MNQADKKRVAIWVRQARSQKGYTQQELSDLAGISLRSVQRIENGETVPREYTLRMLAEKLGVKPQFGEPEDNSTNASQPAIDPTPTSKLNRSRKIILSIGTGLLLVLGTGAYTAQSARFPETAFEGFLLWMGITAVYTVILFKLWK